MEPQHALWIEAVNQAVDSYRRMIDGCLAQLSDDELGQRPAPGFNSVAVILRHLGGNLRSRWTNYWTSDGEKPDRNRESEFLDWDGDRDALMQHFELGWSALVRAIQSLDDASIGGHVLIRGERQTVPQAIVRSITHLSYHVGQIAIISRTVHQGDWKWLSIAPGESDSHNQRTWGTASSRSVWGQL
jgi:hypothetical protein